MIAEPKRGGQQRDMRYGPAENLFLSPVIWRQREPASRSTRWRPSWRWGGRRTVERMRDRLLTMFPEMDSWDDDARARRWRLPGSALVGVVEPPAEAVAAIETAARECEVRGEADRAAPLREASTTLRAVMRPDALRRA
jgi:hypothetical protein